MGADAPSAATLDRFRRLIASHHARRPPLGRALRRDAACFAAHRGESHAFATRAQEWGNVLRLCFASADYDALAIYRLRTALRAWNVPVLPTLLNMLSIWAFKLRIGEHVLIEDGVYIPHGTAVIDGVTTVGTGSVISPWVTVGVKAGNLFGPTIEPAVFIGSHASVLGEIKVGLAARIGAGAVVVHDVKARSIVAGIPARVLAEDVPGPLDPPLPIVEVSA